MSTSFDGRRTSVRTPCDSRQGYVRQPLRLLGTMIERIYTQDQRDAIYRLIHEEGKPAPEAVALAAEGVYGLEPFHMPASSALVIANRVRASRHEQRLARLANGTDVEQLLAARIRLHEIHRDAVRRFCATADRGEGQFDWQQFRWLVRTQKALEDLHRSEFAGGSVEGEDDRDEASAFLADLARRLEEQEPGGRVDGQRGRSLTD